MTTQKHIIEALKTVPTVNTEVEINRRAKFLEDSIMASGAKGLVLGLSGGADSTLAAFVARRAIDNLNLLFPNEFFILHAIMLPEKAFKSNDKDVKDAIAVSKNYVKFDDLLTIPIEKTKNSAIYEYILGFKEGAEAVGHGGILTKFGHIVNDTTKGNISARVRMIQLYTHAALNNLLVLGTDNAAEQLTGFYTKHGDGAYDVNPLQTLTKRQVFQMLKETGAPESIITKAPAANLSESNPGRTDEEELGLSYSDIDDFLEGKQLDLEIEKKLIARYDFTQHKREMPKFI